eukprot:CCRYP_003026-RA/>CCRYP_003026-RA protein AED:0.43 eAED:0.43 QI:105/1/0.5/1/0/0/2/0/65
MLLVPSEIKRKSTTHTIRIANGYTFWQSRKRSVLDCSWMAIIRTLTNSRRRRRSVQKIPFFVGSE